MNHDWEFLRVLTGDELGRYGCTRCRQSVVVVRRHASAELPDAERRGVVRPCDDEVARTVMES